MPHFTLLALAWTITLAGCGALGGGAIATRQDGVRTFRVDSSLGCALGPDPADPSTVLRGTIGSDPSRAVDSVWLATDAGDVHVVWPDAWTFAFGSAGVTMVDGDGYAMAAEGDEVVLQDHRVGEVSGSESEPYIASGRIGANCYPRG